MSSFVNKHPKSQATGVDISLQCLARLLATLDEDTNICGNLFVQIFSHTSRRYLHWACDCFELRKCLTNWRVVAELSLKYQILNVYLSQYDFATGTSSSNMTFLEQNGTKFHCVSGGSSFCPTTNVAVSFMAAES